MNVQQSVHNRIQIQCTLIRHKVRIVIAAVILYMHSSDMAAQKFERLVLGKFLQVAVPHVPTRLQKRMVDPLDQLQFCFRRIYPVVIREDHLIKVLGQDGYVALFCDEQQFFIEQYPSLGKYACKQNPYAI